jgi:hypothetical protein
LSGEGSGECARRRPAVTPAAGCGSGWERAMSSNGWRHELLWHLGSGLEGLGALEKGRGGELAGGRQWRARRRVVAARGKAWLGLYKRAHPGDVAVMAQDASVAQWPWPVRVRRGAADGPPVRGEPRAGTARRGARGPREDSEESRGAAHGEVRASGGSGLGRCGARTPRPTGERQWREDARNVACGGALVCTCCWCTICATFSQKFTCKLQNQ